MSDITVSNDVDNLLKSQSQSEIRDNAGLGTSDTVTFGALETTQLTFPNLTTSELNSVTDAVTGDTYFNSDATQFVRFSSPSTYDSVTSVTEVIPDNSSPSSAITLANSKLFESGAIEAQPAGNSDSILRAYTGGITSSVEESFIWDSDNNWDNNNPLEGVQTYMFETDRLYTLTSSNGITFFDVRRIVTSSTADNNLFTKSLKAGSTYVINAKLNIADMAEGNLGIDSNFTGLYSDAIADINLQNATSKDVITSSTLSVLDESELIGFGGGSYPLGVSSPLFGVYTLRFVITPSTDGDFTLSVRQLGSNVEPLFIGKGQYSITTSV